MRTSHIQYAIMVEFMEKHGDLSKPSGGPRGRHFIQEKWKTLTDMLNSDGSGDSRPEDKWRKVWSDWKNNTKKKMAKIARHAKGTGGGPALQSSLSDLENRVIQIIGVQAAVGMPIEEAGFERVGNHDESAAELDELTVPQVDETIITDWSQAGEGEGSQEPPSDSEHWEPPPPKKKKTKLDNLTRLFVQSDEKAREIEQKRLRQRSEEIRLRGEELRLREVEMQERVRQRDMELALQAKWLEFMQEAMSVLARIMEIRD